MPLNIEKSGEQDKEQSKEWLLNTNPNINNFMLTYIIQPFTENVLGIAAFDQTEHTWHLILILLSCLLYKRSIPTKTSNRLESGFRSD